MFVATSSFLVKSTSVKEDTTSFTSFLLDFYKYEQRGDMRLRFIRIA
ncbi:hypothetical protein AAAC51_01475 [Priestia megaterium]